MRKPLPDKRSDHITVVTPEAHSEYDPERRLKLGPDEKVRVDGFPVVPTHGRAQLKGGRAP